MQPLQPAELPKRSRRQIIREAIAAGFTKEQAQRTHRELKNQKVFINDLYQVNVVEGGDGVTHLSIKRRDKAPVTDWRDKQVIKNQLCGEEREAVELYPAESRLVDMANQFHLWVLPEGIKVPVGFDEGRRTTDKEQHGTTQRKGSNQRATYTKERPASRVPLGFQSMPRK